MGVTEDREAQPPAAGDDAGRPAWPWLVLLGIACAAGVAARVALYRQSIVGDELSTLWIVETHGAGGVVDFVRGDGEITPPLFFLLAWAAAKLGSAPELIRLPSLLAGLASIGLYFLVARRLFGRCAGMIAAGCAALSPLLVYFSANGRAYSVMICLLLIAVWAALRGVDGGGWGWWALFGLASAAAMYAHYTALFTLAAIFLWIMWVSPASRRPALIAAAGAALLFLPWLPGYLADADSPTIPILEALQGQGFAAKREAVEQLLFWRIDSAGWTIGGRLDVILISAGILLAAAAALYRAARLRGWGRPRPGTVLMLAVLLATPLGALAVGLVSTDTFGGRNLAPCWVAIPPLVGLLLSRLDRATMLASGALIAAGLGVATAELASRSSEIPFRQTAAYLEEELRPGDAVVNRTHVTPVPLTPLDVYLDPEIRQYRLGMNQAQPPFLPGAEQIPDASAEMRDALRSSDRILFVTIADQEQPVPGGSFEVGGRAVRVPGDWRVADRRTFDGIYPLTVTTLEPGPGTDAEDRK